MSDKYYSTVFVSRRKKFTIPKQGSRDRVNLLVMGYYKLEKGQPNQEFAKNVQTPIIIDNKRLFLAKDPARKGKQDRIWKRERIIAGSVPYVEFHGLDFEAAPGAATQDGSLSGWE